eukprot:2824346-Amphidinium_carterae.1
MVVQRTLTSIAGKCLKKEVGWRRGRFSETRAVDLRDVRYQARVKEQFGGCTPNTEYNRMLQVRSCQHFAN